MKVAHPWLFPILFGFLSTVSIGQETANNPVPVEEAKNSWKIAQEKATSVDMISVPEGFAVELVRSANEGEGSWITLEFDDKNHLFVAKEDKGILRFTIDSNGHLIDKLLVNEDIEQCRGLLWAYDSLYVNSNNPMIPPQEVKEKSNGLFVLKDNDNDGIFEESKKLLETKQEMPGHGRNQMRLGPDGLIYFMTGYDVYLSEKIDLEKSFLKNFREDNLIPNPWDEEWFNKHASAPGGHLVRMDKDGKYFQLVAGGFRNPMDLAFNRDNEIFTYDADMEWDAALPWYKPTRVLHLVAGADYGWRRATAKWPDYYEDSLPAVVDVGLGSPTGIEFGYQSSFPDRWKDALFVGDWTYGRIIAVDLQEKGASYTGASATFASGRPMNVVDLTFGPDGHLYFVTGGMKTKSGIYRIRWTGEIADPAVENLDPAIAEESKKLRLLRYQLEYNELEPQEKADFALRHINHPDDFVRHAARLALEKQEPKYWAKKALDSKSPAAFIALARAEKLNPKLISQMNRIKLGDLDEKSLLGMLRAYQLVFSRHGMPSPNDRSDLVMSLSELFPNPSTKVNHEITELLVYLEVPQTLSQLIAMINESKTTEDLAQFLVYARYIEDGWDLETKRSFLKGVQRLEAFPGGKFHQKVIDYLRKEMVERLSNPEKMALERWMVPDESAKPKAPVIENLTFVKNWQVDDFEAYFNSTLSGRNFERGEHAYSKSNCATCHRMEGNAASSKGVLGPDLSNVGGRFGIRDLLVSIIHPSQAINDKYRNPAAPNLSTMPPAQINVLTEEEVIDLIAYLQAGGRKNDLVFQGKKTTVQKTLSPPKAKVITEDKAAKKMVQGPSELINKTEIDDPAIPQIPGDHGIKIKPTFFPKNSAANLEDRPRLYQEMKKVLDTYPNATFELVGHADDSPYSKTNHDISLNRARFTAGNMIYRGIPKSIVTYRGAGDKEPSQDGNKRVEVIVKLK